MWKMVLSDLRCGLKPGLKRALKRTDCYGIGFYLLFAYPVISRLQGREMVLYYSGVFPMLLAMTLRVMYGGEVDKVMYLCPLSKEERRRYFVVSWGIRAGLPVLLSSVFEGAFCIAGWISPFTAMLLVASTAFFSFAMNLYANMPKGGEKDERLAYYTAWNVVVFVLGISTIIFWVGIVGDVKNPRFTGGEVGVGMILFFVYALAALILIVKYFDPVMEGLSCYERPMPGGRSYSRGA